MRFKHIQPHRTFSNYILTEIASYIDFFYTSLGWFDWTEPSLTTSLQDTCWGWFKHTEPPLATSLGWFKHIEPPRTCTELSLTTSLQGKQGVQGAYALVRGGSSTTNLLELSHTTSFTGIARCVEFCHMSSGWFDCTKPSLSTSL